MQCGCVDSSTYELHDSAESRNQNGKQLYRAVKRSQTKYHVHNGTCEGGELDIHVLLSCRVLLTNCDVGPTDTFLTGLLLNGHGFCTRRGGRGGREGGGGREGERKRRSVWRETAGAS